MIRKSAGVGVKYCPQTSSRAVGVVSRVAEESCERRWRTTVVGGLVGGPGGAGLLLPLLGFQWLVFQPNIRNPSGRGVGSQLLDRLDESISIYRIF